ncbi:MAG: replication-relaxation family protein [Bradyrhizobiaceae bacterium]|nr:replication-relaxation family protein [Bradyrhizobiaceae bacterium]
MAAVARKTRAKRFERQNEPAPFQLTARDVSILGCVAQHRFLSSRHLAMLDGGSEQNLLRCLRVLFDHGYLDRPLAQLAYMPVTGPRPMVYGLGRRGAEALRAHGGTIEDSGDWTEKNKRAGAKFIEHTLAIADFMVSLEIACRNRLDADVLTAAEILADAPEQTQAAREPLRLVVPGLDNRFGVASVIADGLFGLLFSDDTAAYFLLEVDRGTMPVRRSRFDKTSFGRKLRVYWEAWKQGRHVEQFGVKQLRVLTVTPGRERVAHMLDVVKELTDGKGSNFFLFAAAEQFADASPLDVEWTTGRGERVKLTD